MKPYPVVNWADGLDYLMRRSFKTVIRYPMNWSAGSNTNEQTYAHV